MQEKRLKTNEEQLTEEPQVSEQLSERLMEEINILRLEGALFCFDPKEARRRSGTHAVELSFPVLGKQAVTVEIHPKFGQPSVLAYKVLQAIFLKLSEQGCELTEDGKCLFPDRVSFSQRELARLTGREWSGTNVSAQLYAAMMQLHHTSLQCSLYEKETDEWVAASLYVLPHVLFAGKGSNINMCVAELDKRIVASLNRRHVAFFNLQRLNSLETIGVVLYKRLFLHLSNLNQSNRSRQSLKFEKDYEDICREWLGGLKPEKYKSKILQNQLGRHLEALKQTSLIRRFEIKPKASGEGYKLVVYPGQGFFDDYRDYYLKGQQPKALAGRSAEVREIQQPLELVAHFHKLLGREQHRFEEKETAYAAELLTSLSETEVRDLIEYAVEKAKQTDFAMRWFGAVKLYLDAWRADRESGGAKVCH